MRDNQKPKWMPTSGPLPSAPCSSGKCTCRAFATLSPLRRSGNKLYQYYSKATISRSNLGRSGKSGQFWTPVGTRGARHGLILYLYLSLLSRPTLSKYTSALTLRRRFFFFFFSVQPGARAINVPLHDAPICLSLLLLLLLKILKKKIKYFFGYDNFNGIFASQVKPSRKNFGFCFFLCFFVFRVFFFIFK